jgi:hypothetical protein
MMVEGETAPVVIIIGAGVSGCACAAALGSAGLRVTLVNNALDGVGMPAYGPDLLGQDDGWQDIEEILQQLPPPLHNVWLQASTRPASGEAIVNVDRRKVSIETKRCLEQIPGLQFRQGFVTDLRLLDNDGRSESGEKRQHGVDPQDAAGREPATDQQDVATQQRADCQAYTGAEPHNAGQDHGDLRFRPEQRVEAETIFGEVFSGDALVVATGLSLGGRITTGDDCVEGGRYGEPASEGVRMALEAFGAEFRTAIVHVGPRAAARDVRACAPEQEMLVPVASDCYAGNWPVGYPPAPHWHRDLMINRMVMMPRVAEERARHRSPVLSPDGAATSEVYLAPRRGLADGAGAVLGQERVPIATRMALTVTGLAVSELSVAGRMRVGEEARPVWVIGRSAGARNYVASLLSGVRAADDIARSMRPGRVRTIETAATSHEPECADNHAGDNG